MQKVLTGGLLILLGAAAISAQTMQSQVAKAPGLDQAAIIQLNKDMASLKAELAASKNEIKSLRAAQEVTAVNLRRHRHLLGTPSGLLETSIPSEYCKKATNPAPGVPSFTCSVN